MTTRFHSRDPMSPEEARATAREILRELGKTPPYLPAQPRGGRLEDIPGEPNPEFIARASVLADVLLYYRPEVGEALALALSGRLSSYSTRSRFSHLVSGAQLPEGVRFTELVHVIDDVRRIIVPPRRGPCLPNAKELRELIESGQGESIQTDRMIRDLNAHLRAACTHGWWRNVEDAMVFANAVMAAHGVERAVYMVGRGRGRLGDIDEVADFYYVNTGDTYNTTLVADNKTHRFRISTWGDEVERAERRFGEGGTWRV